MQYSNIPLAQMVVAYCEANKIQHIVISPGSRNAPLTIGFTFNPSFKCYSIVDERCAAFFALGIAQQLQEPVALLCTSGSALLNYYPAISEAFFSDIPLVVLSADRPEDRIGIGDGQTIYQENVYGKHVVAAANLKSGIDSGLLEHNAREIERTLSTCLKSNGPVHINVPFNEPLYGRTDKLLVPLPKALTQEQHSKLDSEQERRFNELWKTSKKKMLLVGVLNPNELDQEVIDFLAQDDGLMVFTETTSNLVNDEFFPSIDKIIAPLNESGFKDLQPDLLVTMGGLVVSKKIKAFLRDFPAKEHWHIGTNRANDTFFYLTEHVTASPNAWFKKIKTNLQSTDNSTYRTSWKKIANHRDMLHNDYMKEIPFSDLLVFHMLLQQLPKDLLIQMGNSSTIRYAQLFRWNHNSSMFCNRGTSGIDGSTSTAIGAAVVSRRATLFVTGDLSFFYDSNALWNNYIPNNFKILLINNSGGGIFRILPGHKNTDNFDTYFETKHHLNAQHLCKMFGFQYLSASNEADLNNQLKTFFRIEDTPVLLEVSTPSQLNDEVLLNYFEFIK
ncbi:2-succinyl-5-enolpyruvyl-6-hydroxy-3-cyclohexene-1-carboxylic-acid synthase [Winogradskyella aurantiaca]|uniref:2-succinyl-5-enolpyruvyl-6-hydroxy-3- cyclohexene-1-carboxylic-acid synthase n=1 Tax=Winogradskyella aurantiaca TaxID=2219558 RepID=UPI000E1E26C6|nr:2-succinyl-5-enolpyruvyl-6-hydroxy-3-cyclohexene-1-carboxylic-acid synthase [Winogradskyella aurantiaca]